MPGGGITERNLRRVLDETGAREFHGSARSAIDSDMEYRPNGLSMGAMFGPSEFVIRRTSSDRVKGMIRIGKQAM